jgi:hypothetical protein
MMFHVELETELFHVEQLCGRGWSGKVQGIKRILAAQPRDLRAPTPRMWQELGNGDLLESPDWNLSKMALFPKSQDRNLWRMALS